MGYYHYPVFHFNYVAACSFLSHFLFLVCALFHTHSLLLLIFFLFCSVIFPSLCLFSCAPFPSLSLSSCIIFLLLFLSFFFCLIFFSPFFLRHSNIFIRSQLSCSSYSFSTRSGHSSTFCRNIHQVWTYKSSSNKRIDNTKTADT